MVLVYQDKEISTLEDIQKLKVKDLREILRSNSEATGGIKADLVLKVYAILMRNVLRPGENQQQTADNIPQNDQSTAENGGEFKYDDTLRRISALGWSTDLRQLPELNFIQLYDYLVVSTRKYRLKPKLINFDPRPPQQRNRDAEGFKTLSENLQNCLPSSSFFLFHDLKSNCSEEPTLQETEEQVEETVAFTDSYDIATNRFKTMIDEHVTSLTITPEEIKETERLTRGQSKNDFWFEKRKTVLTASNFGNAAKTKVEPSNKIKAILYGNFTTEAVQYGIESEEKAVNLFIKEMGQDGIRVKVEETGLSLSKDKPYLGASLDRIVTIMDTGEKWGMEIKSPFSKAGMTVDEACKAKNFFLEKLADGSVQLKRNHNYFCQIQGQLYCSLIPLEGIFLVVYFGENMPLFIEKILFDNSKWRDDLLPKIDYFYRRAFFPEVLTGRVKRGKVLYLHGGWLPFGHYSSSRSGLKLTLQREK